jgi:hypothetical protein
MGPGRPEGVRPVHPDVTHRRGPAVYPPRSRSDPADSYCCGGCRRWPAGLGSRRRRVKTATAASASIRVPLSRHGRIGRRSAERSARGRVDDRLLPRRVLRGQRSPDHRGSPRRDRPLVCSLSNAPEGSLDGAYALVLDAAGTGWMSPEANRRDPCGSAEQLAVRTVGGGRWLCCIPSLPCRASQSDSAGSIPVTRSG